MRTILVVLSLLLAGCSGSDSSDDEPTPFDGDDFTIVISDLPVAPVMPGEEFTFTSTISGARTTTSDHIGGHFDENSTGAPSVAAYSYGCVHQSGDLPGEYTITCVAPAEQDVFYLRGHARVGAPGEEVHWWSAEHTFTVAGPVE